MATKIHYGLTGEKRKQLAVQISQFLDEPSTYMGVPTCNYKIGDYLIDKEGTLICPDCEHAQNLITQLAEAGFIGEIETPDITEDATSTQVASSEDSLSDELPTEEDAEKELVESSPEPAPEMPNEAHKSGNAPTDTISKENTVVAQENGDLEISIPRELMSDEALGNLRKLIDNKSNLFRHAFMVNSLRFVITEEKIIFPWFSYTEDSDRIKAYMQFIDALCLAAREAKNIRAKEEAPDDNEKFTMRLFLVTKLHMIGDDYKTTRKILLKNLSGNSSWRNGKPNKGEHTNE